MDRDKKEKKVGGKERSGERGREGGGGVWWTALSYYDLSCSWSSPVSRQPPQLCSPGNLTASHSFLSTFLHSWMSNQPIQWRSPNPPIQ